MAEFRMQDPGEGIHEAEFLEVKVDSGDRVEEGDTLFAVETDKAVVDVPSPFTGEITDVRVKQGETARVGDVLLTYEEEGGERKPPREPREGEKESPPKEAREEEPRKAAERELEEKKPGPVPASPATRRVAREEGVDLARVEASGPHGRVTMEDVRRAAEQAEPEAAPEERQPERKVPAPPSEALPDFEQWGPIETVPLRGIRRATARQMERSWRVPQVTHQDLADITELEAFRRRHAEAAKERGGKLTMTILIMKAAAAALRRFPRFNASLDNENETIILKRYIHMGVAVATDQGLLVPVVRDVDRKGLTELAVEVTALAEKARAGKIEVRELQGGSFSLTNPGGIGGTWFTPLINPPEAAILGMTRADWRPVLQGDPERGRFEARLMLPLSLTFDHRVNDGAEAAQFVRDIAAMLKDPEALLLGV